MSAALFYAQVLRLLLAMLTVYPAGSSGVESRAADRYALAVAIVEAGATSLEQEWLVAVAYRESGFELAAVGDFRSGHAASFSAFQIHLPGGARTAEGWSGPELCADPGKAATAALRLLRRSFAACSALPKRERLAAYASGSCASPRGQRLSRDRDAVRRGMFGGAP